MYDRVAEYMLCQHPMYKEVMMAGEKLTKAEREVICEALEIKMKSHERAAKSSSGAIAQAHEQARDAVYALFNKIKTGTLEL